MMPQLQLRLRFAFFLSALFFAGVFHLGSSSLITDRDGSLVRQQYGYRAFGSERFSLNFIPFTSRFTGQPYDTETGLYYYQSRYYDPELGRFIQPDSIIPDPGSSQSLNRYSYVLNNPLKYIDPSGHAPQGMNWNGSSGWMSPPGWMSPGGWMTPPGWIGTASGYGPSQWDPLSWKTSLAPGPEFWQGAPYRPGGPGPATAAGPYAHWDYSRTPTVGETVKTVASVALLAVPASAPARIIGAALRVARAAAAARVGATFGVTRMAPIIAKSGVWSLGPGPRGLAIEAQLGGNLPAGFRVIDRFDNGVATSIKSIDLSAATYKNPQALSTRLSGYVDSLAGWTGQTTPYGGMVIQPGQVTAKTLQVAVPPGSMSTAQQAVFNAAAERARRAGINFMVTPVK
jgi:RHS repeat-associated protein